MHFGRVYIPVRSWLSLAMLRPVVRVAGEQVGVASADSARRPALSPPRTLLQRRRAEGNNFRGPGERVQRSKAEHSKVS